MSKIPALPALWTLSLAIIVVVLCVVPAVPQDPSYHNFADQRTIFFIPNFFNVVTNVPFIVTGLMGLRCVVSNGFSGVLPVLRTAYATFFLGMVGVGFGSSIYHLAPNNQSLVWDRLPMTVVFMAFFSIIVSENIALATGKRLLLPLLVLGVLSVVYWYWTELQGNGDLRPYALVQFMPMLLIPFMLLLGQARLANNRYRWALLGAYAAAKLAEVGDEAIYRLLGMLSGHSIKHLLVAAGVWIFYVGLQKREQLT
ncbi:MAG: alkaline phytoceramidase [Methylococcaceae bacterium]|nr:alkaline phytoceramidase [Methylococcaceae bacterium]